MDSLNVDMEPTADVEIVMNMLLDFMYTDIVRLDSFTIVQLFLSICESVINS